MASCDPMTPNRSAEERERMRALMFHAERPLGNAANLSATERSCLWDIYDRLLAAFPQLWDSLPPDPAETARREAEEDGEMVDDWRRVSQVHGDPLARSWSRAAVDLADRMTARAAKGYPVLIAPKGE